ncbi:MAG: alkyl sulfatase dimerization domain-containing protein [Pseudomonadota bacterium]
MPNAALLHHAETQFPQTVVELAPGMWTAVGFAASTQHMIEGRESVTIIDTSESTGAAQNVRAAFQKRSEKPVGRIIYTHSHRDHICGSTVFADGRDIPILASASFKSDLVAQDANAIAPAAALNARTAAQFGIGLTTEERVSLGCGPGDRPMEGLGAGFLLPNCTIDGDQHIDLDGIAARLIMVPGETADHMAVWLPEAGVLFPGDTWYHAFPNLYAIRGTPYRDFGQWAESLELLAELGAQVLAPGHTMPIFGADRVREVLTTTRDAILHVMRYTAERMDAGVPIDDIVAGIALPSELADKPWLGEFYGKLAWSARAYAMGTLGWYDGNPTTLGTISTRDRARHLSDLAGGLDALRAAAEGSADPHWRLELCDALVALGQPAKTLKAEILEALAEAEINATARNTYLWHARRLRAAEAAS